MVFTGFIAAINFVNRVAGVAESINHHPDLSVHYKQVTVSCWTHDVDGLTALDFKLAGLINRVVGGETA